MDVEWQRVETALSETLEKAKGFERLYPLIEELLHDEGPIITRKQLEEAYRTAPPDALTRGLYWAGKAESQNQEHFCQAIVAREMAILKGRNVDHRPLETIVAMVAEEEKVVMLAMEKVKKEVYAAHTLGAAFNDDCYSEVCATFADAHYLLFAQTNHAMSLADRARYKYEDEASEFLRDAFYFGREMKRNKEESTPFYQQIYAPFKWRMDLKLMAERQESSARAGQFLKELNEAFEGAVAAVR